MHALADWIRVKLRNEGWPHALQVHLQNRKVIIGIDADAASHSGAPLEQESPRNERPTDPRDGPSVVERRKHEFLAILSHELRAPLVSIRYAVAVLRRQTDLAPASERQHLLTLIERQVGRMTDLLNELLDVSRITSGHLRLSRERCDLCAVVKNAIETLEPGIRERSQRLSAELPDAPVWLQADARRLEQVFVNLLANASRYTDAEGELKVSVHARDGQGTVRFQDSGVGIAADALPHIFDLFRQGNEADPHSTDGLGVGLAVVRQLVELHGGSVTAASAGASKGSEFTVQLPTDD